jgi:hypothetical protein
LCCCCWLCCTACSSSAWLLLLVLLGDGEAWLLTASLAEPLLDALGEATGDPLPLPVPLLGLPLPLLKPVCILTVGLPA